MTHEALYLPECHTLLQVPLGVLLKNENKGDEMVEIMSHLHQYVPSFEYTRKVFLPSSNETTEVPEAVFHTILFGGDQLTAARARGSKRMMINASSRVKRLEGMIPVAEDWHTKLNPLDVCFTSMNLVQMLPVRPNK